MEVSIHATLAGGDFKEINYGQAGGIVSIHATLAGGDGLEVTTNPTAKAVSIHATLAGGDTAIVGMFGENAGFYPRHPRGWRPPRRRRCTAFQTCFYPRHPRGWRRCSTTAGQRRSLVSIHATLAGGDAVAALILANSALFLSTPPSRVATLRQLHCRGQRMGFYPRHPRGWRLKTTHVAHADGDVSIHATLAGGDPTTFTA